MDLDKEAVVMDYETEEAQIIADRDWWQALLPGAKLVGWSGRDSATFRDEKTRDVFHIPGIAAHYIAAAIREAVEERETEILEKTETIAAIKRNKLEDEGRGHTMNIAAQLRCDAGACAADEIFWSIRALSGEK